MTYGVAHDEAHSPTRRCSARFAFLAFAYASHGQVLFPRSNLALETAFSR